MQHVFWSLHHVVEETRCCVCQREAGGRAVDRSPDNTRGPTMHSTQLKASASLRRKNPRAVLFALATLALALLPVEAQAACRGGFCVKGFDQSGRHTVIFTTSLSNYTH